MKNTDYDGYLGPRLSRDVQLRRLQRVMDNELTACQRETVIAHYLEKKSMRQIADQRAERRMRRCLRY